MNPSPAPASVSDQSETGIIPVSNARRWTIVWLLFAASMINYFDRQTLSYALPLLAKEFNLDPIKQGLLSSAFFWSYALMQIPMGLCADRLNLRWLYAAAFTVWSFAQGMTAFVTSLTSLIGCRILLGLGEAIYLVGGTKVVSLLFPLRDRGLPCGLFDAGTRTGLVLEGLTIGLLLKAFGWRITFATVGFVALLWLVPWFLATPKQMGNAATLQPQIQSKLSWIEITELFKNRDFLGVLLGFFCFDYFWYLLLTWLPSYFVQVRHVTILEAGIRASIPFLVFGVSQPLGGWLADHFIRRGFDPSRTRKTIISLSFLCGLLIIPAATAETKDMALLFVAGACLVGLSTANQLVLLQGCTPPHKIGLAVGVYNFVGNIAGVLGPVITGVIIQLSGGSYTPAFVAAALMIAAGQFCYWFLVGKAGETQGGQAAAS